MTKKNELLNNEVYNNERLNDLLAYLNGLTKLTYIDGGYTCTREIGECIGWIREELSMAGRYK